jgi:tol-pal system protein YbgF
MVIKNGIYAVSAIFLLNIVLLMGCATTQQYPRDDTPVGDVADIDQLLGLGEEETEAEESIDEDDVMKLLGVVEDKSEVSELGDASETTGDSESYDASLSQSEEGSSSLSYAEEKVTAVGSEKKSFEWKTDSFSSRYKEALHSYKGKKYREAIQKFEALLVTNRKHTLSDNCQYWIGESYYGLGSYQQAIVAFQKVFAFEKSNKNDAAQLKLGICYMRLNDEGKAKTEFQKLISQYPTSEYNSVAKRFIEKIK